jgi:hypothetical protein
VRQTHSPSFRTVQLDFPSSESNFCGDPKYQWMRCTMLNPGGGARLRTCPARLRTSLQNERGTFARSLNPQPSRALSDNSLTTQLMIALRIKPVFASLYSRFQSAEHSKRFRVADPKVMVMPEMAPEWSPRPSHYILHTEVRTKR